MKNLLLIIDMQKGFRYKEPALIIPNIQKLIETFDGDIVATKFVNKKDSFFEKSLKWKKFQNKKEQEIMKELQKYKLRSIDHNTYAILNKRLLSFIKNKKVKDVYLCGLYTDVSIIKTALDLFDNKINCFIIEDACAGQHGTKLHRSAIESMTHSLGKDKILKTKYLI